MERMIRDRRLTAEEAAEYDVVREQIEQEKPEQRANPRSVGRSAQGRSGSCGCSHAGPEAPDCTRSAKPDPDPACGGGRDLARLPVATGTGRT